MKTSKENGVVEVPKTYFFKMAKLDYASWKRALPREFYQNAVDAGASMVEVTVDPKSRAIHVIDNGCGMDYETIKEKLLVLGGSKKAEGAVGAFGKAKEILFFSWKKYRIRTQNLLVTGEGASYAIEKVKDWQDGTVCSIWIWEDEDFDEVTSQFRRVARLFEVDCGFQYMGDIQETSLRRGKLVRSMDWADVYFDDSYKAYQVSVRINGQWMFEEWLSGSSELGKIVLEVHGDSTHVLTSNRDSLKGEYLRKFRELVAEFITETLSALRPEPVVVREKFTGTGRVAVSKVKAAERVSEYLQELEDKPTWERDDVTAEEVTDAVIDRMIPENVNTVVMDRVEETAKRGSYWDYEDRFSFIGFQPDFHVVYEEGSKTGRKLERYMQWPSVKRLANAWTEILKQVMLDIEEYTEFNVGFNFKSEEAASYERVSGEHYFYLNPDLLLSDCEGKFKWWHQRTLLREDLIAKAIHEVTHIYCESHNQEYQSRNEWIRARTWKSLKVYPKIITECFRK